MEVAHRRLRSACLHVIIRFITITLPWDESGTKKKEKLGGEAMTDDSNLPVPIHTGDRRPSTLDHLADIPEEEIWLSKQKSARTRRAYRLDVQHFMRTLAITTPAELRQADHKAVIAWERYMRETEHATASTIRRRLAALSSLYKHLIRHDHATCNPVGEVERPAINRDEGSTLAFSKEQARKMLHAP